MADDPEIKALSKEISALKDVVEIQFGHGRKHFESLEGAINSHIEDSKEQHETLQKHAEIIGSFNEGVLDGVNERAAFIDELMKQQRDRTALLKAMREEVAKKGALALVVCITALVLMYFGFDEYAMKILGIE